MFTTQTEYYMFLLNILANGIAVAGFVMAALVMILFFYYHRCSMKTVNSYARLVDPSTIECSAPAASCSTESSSPGPAAPYPGVVNSQVGGVSVPGLYLILHLAVVLLMPLKVWTQRGRGGPKS